MSPDTSGRRRSVSLVAVMCVLFWSVESCAFAQAPGGGDNLEIVVVEGEGAINNLRQRIVRDPVVRVEDRNRKPVAGAFVTFTLPNQGAGGVFANGARTVTVATDNQGLATAHGIRPVNSGKFQIRVNASSNGRTGSTVINQSNLVVAGAVAGGLSAKLLLLIIAGGAAAAAGGAIAATRGGGGNNSPAPPTGPASVGITPGSPSVGPPH